SGRREIRLARYDLLQEGDRIAERGSAARTRRDLGAQETEIGCDIARAARDERFAADRQLQGAGNLAGDRVLDVEDIAELRVEVLRPEPRAIACPHEANAQLHPI